MNAKLLRILTAIFAIITFITGLGAYVDLLPDTYVKLAGIILVAVGGVKEVAVIVGDIADDGVRNNSFKPPLPLILLGFLCLTLVSCVNDRFLGVDQKGWLDIGQDALKGASKAALPAYLRERQEAFTSGK